MKCVPMIFNREMVCALLEGRKTVTRRPVKPAPPEWCKEFGYTTFTPERHISGRGRYEDQGPAEKFIKQPIFKGDLVWVRETFGDCGVRYVYKADSDDGASCMIKKWTPSIHMPRWANRLVLKVTDVRIERVQEITDDQAEKEGMMTSEASQKKAIECGLSWFERPAVQFKNLWRRIYGDWESNPYVWVIEFEVVNQNIDEYLNGVTASV